MQHGEKYGPSEEKLNSKIPTCQVSVNYVAPCGHKMADIPCDTAFEYASNAKASPECTAQTDFSCPICITQVKSFCWLAQYFATWHVWKDETVLRKLSTNGDICISEANLNDAVIPWFPPKIEKLLPKLCKANLHVFRTCSPTHTTPIACQNLISVLMGKSMLKPCSATVERVLPCNHIKQVLCHTRNENPPPECKETVTDIFTYPCGLHHVTPGKCSKLTALQAMEKPKCNQQITCSRYRCGHSITIPCALKRAAEESSPGEVLPRKQANIQSLVESHIQYCDPERDLKMCPELVSYRYACGHVKKDVLCGFAFSWAADNGSEKPCEEMTAFTNSVCGHQSSAPCFEVKLMQDWNPWAKLKKPEIKEYVCRHDENNEAVIGYAMSEQLELKLDTPPKGVYFLEMFYL